jgi:hypothetical protein
MTPEKLAFIKGNGAKEKGIEKEPLREEPKSDEAPEPMVPEQTKQRPRRQGRVRNERASDASEVLDQLLVPVTFRLQHRVAQALRRAHLEQRLNHVKPDTQQEIVDEALTAWLTKNGYLE